MKLSETEEFKNIVNSINLLISQVKNMENNGKHIKSLENSSKHIEKNISSIQTSLNHLEEQITTIYQRFDGFFKQLVSLEKLEVKMRETIAKYEAK